jgi:hypothetical protein
VEDEREQGYKNDAAAESSERAKQAREERADSDKDREESDSHSDDASVNGAAQTSRFTDWFPTGVHRVRASRARFTSVE